MSAIIFVTLSSGRAMVYASPSMIHPSISLIGCHNPSPLSIFFSAIGSPPLCFVMAGGGNIVWIPCNIALLMCRRLDLLMSFVIAMKSSTYTSINVVASPPGGAASWYCIFGSNIRSSKMCSGSVMSSRRSCSMTSRPVSDAEQNKGGDSHHPICNEFGTTNSMSSKLPFGSSDGST